MNKTLYTINTVNNFMEIIFRPFGIPFQEQTDGLTTATLWMTVC